MDAFTFDDTEWLRDELLNQADDWVSVLDRAEVRQAAEIRRACDQLVRLRQVAGLVGADLAKVDMVIEALRDQLMHLRRGQ